MAMNSITMAVIRLHALAMLLPSLSYARYSPIESPAASAVPNFRSKSRRPGRRSVSNVVSNSYSNAAFSLPSPSTRNRRRSRSCNDAKRSYNVGGNTIGGNGGRSKIVASLAPSYFENKGGEEYTYVPPYGMVPRSSQSPIVLNMAPYNDYSDDRFRKKMNDRRMKDPVVQDFGNMRDWQESKTGLGRMGDDKMGDDGVSERFGRGSGGGPMMYDNGPERRGGMDNRGGFDDNIMEPPRQRPPPPPMMREEEDLFEGEGGNFWVNPTGTMDRYPSGGRGNEGMSRRGRGRRSSGSGRRNRRDPEDEDGREFWETRRRDGEFDVGDEFEDFDGDGYRNEYGVPPPSRSRSSFRSGAPPPPRPVKQFYDKLFWFGFDPDVTRPTDRTMFGGTRGKFNAMDLLSDRDQRQQMRMSGGDPRTMRGGRGGPRDGGLGRREGREPDDDRRRRDYEYDAFDGGVGPGGPVPFPGDMPPPPPPPGMPEYDFDPGFSEDMYLDDMDFEGDRPMPRGRSRDRGGRRGRRNNRRSDVDRRAMEYDRLFSGGGNEFMDMDDDVRMPGGGMSGGRPSSRRRRSGFAYKFNSAEDLFDDEGEYIDVEPKYATERDLNMARNSSTSRGGQRRRSWEERAIEMDRVPPRGAVAWGPNGQIGSGEDPLDRAAMEALRDIKKSKKYLERKENAVEDAKDEVVNLKADAAFCENQLEDARGHAANKLEEELGYLMRDVEDSSRSLRMARAERDAASNRVSDLEERNWALLSEYEAARSFEDGMD